MPVRDAQAMLQVKTALSFGTWQLLRTPFPGNAMVFVSVRPVLIVLNKRR